MYAFLTGMSIDSGCRQWYWAYQLQGERNHIQFLAEVFRLPYLWSVCWAAEAVMWLRIRGGRLAFFSKFDVVMSILGI